MGILTSQAQNTLLPNCFLNKVFKIHSFPQHVVLLHDGLYLLKLRHLPILIEVVNGFLELINYFRSRYVLVSIVHLLRGLQPLQTVAPWRSRSGPWRFSAAFASMGFYLRVMDWTWPTGRTSMMCSLLFITFKLGWVSLVQWWHLSLIRWAALAHLRQSSIILVLRSPFLQIHSLLLIWVELRFNLNAYRFAIVVIAWDIFLGAFLGEHANSACSALLLLDPRWWLNNSATDNHMPGRLLTIDPFGHFEVASLFQSGKASLINNCLELRICLFGSIGINQ